MEERAPDYFAAQEDLTPKNIPKSIMKSNICLARNMKERYFRRSKTTVDRSKKVSFPDKFKRPIYIIYEVEPIIYEDIEIQMKVKSKSKGCQCMII